MISTERTPVVLFWSGGKDSAYTLYALLQDDQYDVRYLISTVNGKYQRISMHGIREEVLDRQATNIGIPLKKFYVYEGTNREYEQQMKGVLQDIKSEGITSVAFGDIFLEDLRAYRECHLDALGMIGIFPIWKKETKWLATDFLMKGFKTFTCCVDNTFLTKEWVGRIIDEEFLRKLPASVDPCGENGEFHTLCVAGPIFKNPLSVKPGEIIFRPLEYPSSYNAMPVKGFWYCDFEMA